ncbi:DUF2272 domain-containing protein [Roseococcus sp. YIM B11640]|uniref:DUF2272 domain-containing protein n=1 Tax=Roseococcus sp. YIM B11640 TaxID=3133973 RepID=UPI003C7D15D8
MPRLLILLLLLAGCAAPQVAATLPQPLSYPPAARERMLRLALGEWQDWGCQLHGLPGPSIAPCDRPGTPRPEGAPENFPRVLAYWRIVPNAEGAIPNNRPRYEAALRGEATRPALWAEPYWSAAFISWVMASAGVDAPEFAPDASHARYLDHLDALAAAWPGVAPFLPASPAVAAPAPGDLVCRDRSRRPLADWSGRALERGQFRPMHCDIVVATGPGVVEAVGGNVSDAVTLSRWPADEAGRLLPAEGPPAVVIMQNRLGRTPPWSMRSLAE